MRRFFIDQAVFLIIGIGIMICIPILWGPAFTPIFEIITALAWGFFCRRFLLLPLDLLHGKVTRFVYFASQCSATDYEFYKNKHCCEWKFYYGDRQTLQLLVPITATAEELQAMKCPS